MDQSFNLAILWRSVTNLWISFLKQLPFLVIGAIIFVLFLVAAHVTGRLIMRGGKSSRMHANLAPLLSRLTSAFIVILGLFVAAVVVFPSFKPGDLVAGLGITSVAIGFAFKDILQNFFAGVLILWRQPFVVGDEIRSGNFEGTVEDINIRSTLLKTYDGERAVLPNGDVYTQAILVRTAYDKRRVRFTVGVGYGDSLEQARKVIAEVLLKTEGVLRDPGPWIYVSELAPSSVNLTAYFWVEPKQANVLKVSDRVVTRIKLALDAAQIDMPYPHTVVVMDNDSPQRLGVKQETAQPSGD